MRRRGTIRRVEILEDDPRLDGPVTLVPPDPTWPDVFARERDRIRGALGERALMVEHVGSTSVPGLIAKPIIDIVLAVADSTNEAAYVPDLQRVGLRLIVREPEWYEHRLMRRSEPAVNLHVFSAGCLEIGRMLAFRDRLRTDAADRARYADAKRGLAARTWAFVQDYADAKSDVVEEIVARSRPG
jgi:GrpB-like predicted nucleotidyltransferase (UPF0157 family)